MANQEKSNASFVLILIGSILGILSFIGTIIFSLFPFTELLQTSELFAYSQSYMLFSFFMGIIGAIVCIAQMQIAFKIKEDGLLKNFLYSILISGILMGLDAGIPGILILIGALIGAYKIGDKKEIHPKIISFAGLSGLIVSFIGIINYFFQKNMFSQFSSLLGEQFIYFLNILFYASTTISVISSIIFLIYSFKIRDKQTRKDFIILMIISIASILHIASIIVLIDAIKGLKDLKKK